MYLVLQEKKPEDPEKKAKYIIIKVSRYLQDTLELFALEQLP